MAIIRKKILPKYFDLIAEGKKKFELRLADFDIREGDTRVLEEYDSGGPNRKPTGRVLEKKVTYISKFNLDTYGQRKEIEEKGLLVIQFD